MITFSEPNLLSHTAHSVAKKGVKKRDLDDRELKQLLSELLPLVRVDHVTPPNCDILTHSVKRGLVPPPASSLYHHEDALLHRIGFWTGLNTRGFFLKPRLFTPYYEEAKVGEL